VGDAPSDWLIDNADLLPRGGRVLDVACGKGRHALWLAAQGFDVHAIDRNADAIASLRQSAESRGLRITTAVIDLETDPVPQLPQGFDAVLVFNYLHRPLFPSLLDALTPGGRLFYETFTTRQAERGHPKNPDFLLKDGELPALVRSGQARRLRSGQAPFTELRARAGEFGGRFIASIVAEGRGRIPRIAWASPPGLSSVPTKSCRCSARAAWDRSIARMMRG
jgi:SAM-dependent methyltransferase